MLNTSILLVGVTDHATSQANSSTEQAATAGQNTSFPDDCIKVVFSEMEFLPWDNPDNIVSVEVETVARQIKNNLLVLLFLIGGPANVINMAVFYKQGLQDRVNLCLFALSLADELYLSVATLMHGEQLKMQFTTKDRFGPILIFLTNNNLLFVTAFSFVSPVLSAIIATERCLCVYSPLKFQNLLRARTTAVVVIVDYVVVLLLYVFVVFRYRIGCVYDPTSGAKVTTVVEGELYRAHKHVIDHLDGIVFGAALPGIVMTVVTTTTIMTIVKLRQVVTWRSGTSSSISAREIAVTKMLVGSSLLFMVCMAPIAVGRFSFLFLPELNSGRRHQNFFLTCLWVLESCSFINSTFNFFVYYSMGSRFRETCRALFRRNSQPQTATSTRHRLCLYCSLLKRKSRPQTA